MPANKELVTFMPCIIKPFAIKLPETVKLPVILVITAPETFAEIIPFASITMPEPANVGNNAIILDLTLAFV